MEGFFGAAGIAAFIGLSPIVGAFSVGMAVASTRVIKQIGEYVSKLEIIFAPLFSATYLIKAAIAFVLSIFCYMFIPIPMPEWFTS